MFIDISEIGAEGLSFNGALELRDLTGERGEPLQVHGAVVSGEVRRGKRGFELRGRLDARLQLGCSRCLETFEAPHHSEFLLTLVAVDPDSGEPDAGLDDEDPTLFRVTGSKVDLAEIAAEQVYLQLPLKPLCAAGCLGLCPTCGANRNRLECGCRRETLDPRLAPLLDLKGRFGGS